MNRYRNYMQCSSLCVWEFQKNVSTYHISIVIVRVKVNNMCKALFDYNSDYLRFNNTTIVVNV